MGHQWGLGMLWNAGVGTNQLDTVLDSDFQSEIDRIQLIGKFKGIFFGVSWDFASKGYIFDPVSEIQRDSDRREPLGRHTAVELLGRTAHGSARAREASRARQVGDQRRRLLHLSLAVPVDGGGAVARHYSDVENAFVRRDAKVYIPDGWLQVLWKDLRLEIEFAGIFGQVQNIAPAEFPPTAEGAKFKLRQWGFAFEGEYRFLGKKLGVFLKGGAASGDPDVVGLSQYEDLATQPVGQKTVSNFAFHPDYRIDLILWRRIMGRIDGAYYLAPAISYDIIRTDFGRVLGARFDFIYSRAMYQQQTYSSQPNLGAEIDLADLLPHRRRAEVHRRLLCFGSVRHLVPAQRAPLPGGRWRP